MDFKFEEFDGDLILSEEPVFKSMNHEKSYSFWFQFVYHH